MMVWHIVKKDVRLLWPILAATGVLQVLLAFARFKAGHFVSGVPIVPGSLLELSASAIVIALVVLQDPVPGVRQDWLVRPIRRRDLFLAKLLFVVVFVQGPWFATDLLQGLANGFPFGQSFAAAAACAIWVLLTLVLPVLAFAALTATMTELVVGTLGVFAIIVVLLIVPGLAGLNRPTVLTGFAWVPSLVREALMLGAALGVLLLQYRWRRTSAARALFVAALVLGQGAPFLPWRAAFRLQQLLAAHSSDSGRVTIAFSPGEGRFRPAPGQGLDDVQEKPGMGAVDVAEENQRRRAEGARTVFVPVHVSGLIQDSRLIADRSEVKLTGQGGVLYHGAGNDLELHATGPQAALHHGFRVPGAVYSRIKADPIDVELDYSFTLFRPEATYALAARNGEQRMPGIGWCATRVDDAGTRILFQCLQPGERPSCLAATLEHAPTHQRNPEVSLCAPDYSPYLGHTLPDALSRFGGRLPFYDPAGSIRYPVGGSQLSDARVLVTAFRPTEHFLRSMTIKGVHLQDWEAMPASTVAESTITR